MKNHNLKKINQRIRKGLLYLLQKTTEWKFDEQLERKLYDRTQRILVTDELFAEEHHWQQLSLEDINLDDASRYCLYQVDTDKKIFETDPLGQETDFFGRKGTWVLRGTRVFYDKFDRAFVKVFEPYSSAKGEAHFLEHALESGVYDRLCPHLVATIKDNNGNFRGYVIKEGKILTIYEFERYIKHAMRDLILTVTQRTGYYFYDLIPQNVILADGEISLIDLESILPIDWFDQGTLFAKNHLHEIDVGWEIQTKFASPKWYRTYLEDLKSQRNATGL